MLKPKKSISSELERFDAVSQVVDDSRSWIELKDIVSLSGVSCKFCKEILGGMVASGLVGLKPNQDPKLPMGQIAYGKRSIVERDAKQRENASEFKLSKSIFALKPELLQGGTYQAYEAKSNQAMSLAMLSRRG